jgi:hypothetical protein
MWQLLIEAESTWVGDFGFGLIELNGPEYRANALSTLTEQLFPTQQFSSLYILIYFVIHCQWYSQ